MRPNNQPADLGQTSASGDFDEVNNRTMDFSDRSDTLKSLVLEQHPRTEYENGFYKPPQGLGSSRGNTQTKDYL